MSHLGWASRHSAARRSAEVEVGRGGSQAIRARAPRPAELLEERARLHDARAVRAVQVARELGVRALTCTVQ